MGVDPVGFGESNAQSFNRYAYGNNNPYRFVDPDGREPEDYVRGAANELISTAKSTNLLLAILPVPEFQYVDQDDGVKGEWAVVGASVIAGGGGLVRAGVKGVAKNAGIVTKDGTEITGLTKHGVDRVIGDGTKRAGTKPVAILDALKNPSKIKEGIDSKSRPFKIYTGENARVVINPESGRIVSTNPLSRDGAHLP